MIKKTVIIINITFMGIRGKKHFMYFDVAAKLTKVLSANSYGINYYENVWTVVVFDVQALNSTLTTMKHQA